MLCTVVILLLSVLDEKNKISGGEILIGVVNFPETIYILLIIRLENLKVS